MGGATTQQYLRIITNMKIYRISKWSSTFEVSQSKRCDTMKWVPVPYNPASYGMSALLMEKDGLEIYGLFILLVLEASQSDTRGVLIRGINGTPHDARTLSVKLRVPRQKIQRALDVLSSSEIGWLLVETLDTQEQIDMFGVSSEPTPIQDESTPSRIEEKRVEEKRVEETDKTSLEVQGVMPSGWKSLSEKAAMTRRVNRNTPLMVELGSLFNRRETTLWTVAEAKALLNILPLDESEYRDVRSYYRATIESHSDIRRRDLITLLHNWLGEVDRATRRKNTATGGVAKKTTLKRGQPADFEDFLNDYNPDLIGRKGAWENLENEYETWKNAKS